MYKKYFKRSIDFIITLFGFILKGFSSLPILTCLKKIVDPSLCLTRRHNTRKSGDIQIKQNKVMTKSILR